MDIHGTPGSESGVTLLRSEDCLGRVNMLDSSIRDWVRPGVRVVRPLFLRDEPVRNKSEDSEEDPCRLVKEYLRSKSFLRRFSQIVLRGAGTVD